MGPLVPVILIHGFGDTARIFRRITDDLEAFGYEVHSLDLVPNNGREGLERLAAQIETYVAAHFESEQKFNLIGFSMGGIVLRYYLQRLGGIERVRRFITISSPHRGTWTAWLRGNPGIRQMRPGSEFLCDLNSDSEVLTRAGLISIWTRFDLMILPARSSVLPVGRSIQVGALAHPLMITHPRVLRLIREILAEEL